MSVPIILALSLLGGLNAAAATYYISNSGSDSNSGTNSLAPWRTIARANRAALKPGDRVLLKSGGLWAETLVPPQSGSLRASILYGSYGSGRRPEISGRNSVIKALADERSPSYALKVHARGNLSFQGIVFSGGSQFAVLLNAATGITFVNCDFRESASSGLNIENGSRDISIKGGSSYDNGFLSGGDDNGIGIGGMGAASGNITIDGLDIHGNRRSGIEIASTSTDAITSGVVIENCFIRDGKSNGIQIGGGHKAIRLLHNRIFANAGYGIFTNEGRSGSPSILVAWNDIENNGRDGTRGTNVFLNSKDIRFENNRVAGAKGVEMEVTFSDVADGNTYIHPQGVAFVKYRGVGYLTMKGYQIASGQDRHSILKSH